MNWKRVVNVVGCHAEGEVNNVIVGGVGDVPGATVFEKKEYIQKYRDDLRKLLLFEPRGGVQHCVNLVVASSNPAADFGYIIMESTEYPAMSGSNTICVATVLLETGMVEMHEPVTKLTLEAPGGLIYLECACKAGKVTQVRFENQPAFVYALNQKIEVQGVGTVTVDVAYGGMTYALTDARALGFELVPSEARDLCLLGQKLKAAAAAQIPVKHPENSRIAGITQTEFTLPVDYINGVLTARNAVIVSPGRVDRSPCGTGTSARLAVMHARGEISPGENFVHESILGTRFDSHIASTDSIGSYESIIPSIAGQAWITSHSQIGLDPSDPFPQGYTLSDLWMSTLD